MLLALLGAGVTFFIVFSILGMLIVMNERADGKDDPFKDMVSLPDEDFHSIWP
jgi:hypothetical protein